MKPEVDENGTGQKIAKYLPALPKGAACERCKRRKIRCSGKAPTCANCERAAHFFHREPTACTYNVPRKPRTRRRMPPPEPCDVSAVCGANSGVAPPPTPIPMSTGASLEMDCVGLPNGNPQALCEPSPPTSNQSDWLSWLPSTPYFGSANIPFNPASQQWAWQTYYPYYPSAFQLAPYQVPNLTVPFPSASSEQLYSGVGGTFLDPRTDWSSTGVFCAATPEVPSHDAPSGTQGLVEVESYAFDSVQRALAALDANAMAQSMTSQPSGNAFHSTSGSYPCFVA